MSDLGGNYTQLVTSPTKTLVARLCEAVDTVKGLEKKGNNLAQSYKYLKAADVAKSLRHELFQRGILIIPDEQTADYAEFMTKSGSNMRICRIKVDYVVTDGVETLRFGAFGEAMDSGDKAIWKAKTGALKYFLRGIGLIPDEKDDPEADEKVDKEIAKPSTEDYEQAFDQRVAQPKVERIAAFQIKALHDAMAKTGKTEANVMERLGRAGCKQFEQVPKADFNDLLKWMMAPTNPPADLTETLQKSLENLRDPKDPLDMSQKAFKAGVESGTKPPADGRTIKMKRMFAITKKKGIPEADLRQMAKEVYGRDSLTELLIPEIEGITKWADQFVMP